MPGVDRLSPLDASFLQIEDDVNHMHIGGVSLFEGPPPAYGELVGAVAGRLPLVPRYRQKVAFVPLDLGRPVWVDDPHFNIEYHVRHTALPTPGGDEQLHLLVGRLMSQALDRHKPLWELWMVENLGGGRWAVVSKVHHCLVDGVSSVELMTVIFSASPEPLPPVPDDWQPAAAPSRAELAAAAVKDLAVSPYRQARGLGTAVRRPGDALERVQAVTRGLRSMSHLVRPTPSTSLNGPIGPHRRYASCTVSLDDVKAVRAGLGGTVNDVVLAVVTGGFRALLASRGEEVDGRVVRTMVPVSVRARDLPGAARGDGTLNNQVSAMFADLPVGTADPVERLASIRGQLEGLKESRQAVAGEALTSLSGFAPPLLLALAARVSTRLAPGSTNVNTVTTNVPGPQFPLYLCGRQMLCSTPYVPIAGPFRVNVAAFSYNGQVSFGITGDYDTAADIDVLARGIEASLAELVERAERPGRVAGGDRG